MLELFRSPRRAMVWFIEASVLWGLVLGVAGMRLGWDEVGAAHFVRAAVIAATAQGSLYYHGLYGPGPVRPPTLFPTILRALSVAAIALWVLFYLVPPAAIGRGVFLGALVAAAIVLPVWRALCDRLVKSKSFSRTAIVLGSGELARRCCELLQGDEAAGLVLAGRLVADTEAEDGRSEDPEVIGHCRDLRRLTAEHGVDTVIVAYAERRNAFPTEALLELKFRGVEIEEGVDFYERMTGRLFVRELKPSHLIFAHGFQARRGKQLAKRALDVAIAAVGLLLSLPLMILTAVAIKLDSTGPIFYSQIRAGTLGTEFVIHKFRSMRVDAEANGATWAAEEDPRITRVGRFIRKTRLDELPQLWNVLAGDMSMVGPRPERPVFVAQLDREIPFFKQRLFAKPGITGHAQVRCRYGASAEDALEKLSYDLFYIKSQSLWFDLSILFDTVKVVLLRIGAR